MNEFAIINSFFKSQAISTKEVLLGIGDDAACLDIPSGYHLLVSTDTLVSDVHFLASWDAYIIAWKSIMVNVSDIIAMGGEPRWLSLALTIPSYNESWLARFSQGFHEALAQYNICLIGGDTTAGPLSVTITIQGIVPKGRAIQRNGASPGDRIWLSGEIGGAAQAVAFLNSSTPKEEDLSVLMQKLQFPVPRRDLISVLQRYATAAIDISDGLGADLNHICQASNLGANLFLDAIPIHPLVKKYQLKEALSFALAGGDDYELCFTTSANQDGEILNVLKAEPLACFPIGFMEAKPGLRGTSSDGSVRELIPQGYSHF